MSGFILKRSILLLVLVLLGFIVFFSLKVYPEASYLKGKNLSFKELSGYFKDLATKKGAVYAFEVLKIAQLAPQTDFHLLGHVVGDVLYKQKGVEGITVCTQDFRNACSHSIVIGIFSDKGEEGLSEITDACKKAPGGTGAYTMCFHGLGHGILASTGYDFAKTVSLCKKTAPSSSQSEYVECFGGAVMEIISGGFHDRHIWASKRLEYLDLQNPLGLCYRDFVDNLGREICMTYITPYLWEAVGANLGNLKDTDFEKSFAICNSIESSQKVERDACFGGFGKEFVSLSLGRDIRKIENMSGSQFSQVYNSCRLAKIKEGTASCIISAVNAIYWGGENKKEASIGFCSTIPDTYFKNTCFINLTSAALYFNRGNDKNIINFCNSLPSNYKNDCFEKIKSYGEKP